MTRVQRGRGRRLVGAWACAGLLTSVFALAGVASAVAAPAHGLNAWGEDTFGQLGAGYAEAKGTETPIYSPLLVDAKSISAGNAFAAALIEDGTVETWGLNASGELGTGKTGPETCTVHEPTTQKVSCRRYPEPVPGLSGVVQLAAAGNHALALLSTGTVMSWGANNDGEVGNGTTTIARKPVAVPGLSGVKAIAAGPTDSFAVLANGTVEAWGLDEYGALGVGTATPGQCANKSLDCFRSPTPVEGLSGATAVAAGERHALALHEDGTVSSWGDNHGGELGDGTMTQRDTPVAVSGLGGVTQLAAGLDSSMALLAAGKVEALGNNGSGQLGLGSEGGQYTTPTPVEGLSGVRGVWLAPGMGMALLESGAVEDWGGEALGKEGKCEGKASFRCPTPTPVEVASGATVIAASQTAYVYSPSSRPTVTAVAKANGKVAGGKTVTVSGENFTGATEVTFVIRNVVYRSPSFKVLSPQQISAVTPAVPETGTADVEVTTPEGTSNANPGDAFVYEPGGVSILGLSPSAGPHAGGTAVTVTGAGFALGSGTKFEFGKAPATSVECTSTSSCTVLTPAGKAGSPVAVKATVGTAKSEANTLATFTYE